MLKIHEPVCVTPTQSMVRFETCSFRKTGCKRLLNFNNRSVKVTQLFAAQCSVDTRFVFRKIEMMMSCP